MKAHLVLIRGWLKQQCFSWKEFEPQMNCVFLSKKKKKYARRLSCACTANFSCSWKLRRVWREAQYGMQMHWMIIASCKHQPRYFNAHLKQQYARIGRTYGGVVIKNYGIDQHRFRYLSPPTFPPKTSFSGFKHQRCPGAPSSHSSRVS